MIINRYNSFKDKDSKFRTGLDAKIAPDKTEGPVTNRLTVSIVMPVYKAEKYILDTLNSIESQSFEDWELIIVNDGSTDQTSSKIGKFIEKNVTRKTKFQILTQKNQGAGVARNNGIKKAQGEYLWIVDSDDFFEPNCLEKMVESAKRNDAEVVIAQSDMYYDSSKSFKQAHFFREQYLPPYEPFSRRETTFNFFKVFIGWSWDKLFRTDYIQNLGLQFQPIRTSNDLYFVYSALVGAKRISTVRDISAHYRFESEGSVSKTRDKYWQNFYLALMELKTFLIVQNLWPEMEREFVDYSVHFILWNLETFSDEIRKQAVEMLKSKWNDDLGISGHEREYFYWPDEFDRYEKLVK
jgi:glycosyltransferase involved in cell wall biosynthesis